MIRLSRSHLDQRTLCSWHRPRPLGKLGNCPDARMCCAILVLLLRLAGNLWPQRPYYWSRTCSCALHPLREGALGLRVYRLKTLRSQMVGKTQASAGQITSLLQVHPLRVDNRLTLLDWLSPWKG